MRTLVVALVMLVAGAADASPISDGGLDLDFDDGPDADVFVEPPNPRIIDIERMHAFDCRLDRMHGGSCMLRGFEDEAELGIDVDAYARSRASGYRIELIERALDEIE